MLGWFLFVKNGDKFSFLVPSLPSHPSSSALSSDKNAEVRADTEELGPVEKALQLNCTAIVLLK